MDLAVRLGRAAIAALALLAASAPAARAVDEVEVDAAMPWNDADGYTPLVVRARAHRALTLTLSGQRGESTATLTLTLADGETARRTLLIPPCPERASPGLSWRCDDGAAGDVVVAGPTIDPDRQDLAVLDPRESLVLADLAKALEERGLNAQRRSWSSTPDYGVDRLARIADEQLPDRWQGWPTWLTLLVTPAGDAALDDAQRGAIADWTRVGGALLVTTPAQVAAWRARGVDAQAIAFDAPAAGARAGSPRDESLPILSARLTSTIEERGYRIPQHRVPGTERVPVGGFIAVAALFALVAGPLNLWWVRRRDARQLFLLTTPLLSLGTCLGLVLFNLMAEGVSLRRVIVQYAVLDQPAQRLAAWTGATYFAAFAPGPIALDAEAKLWPMDATRDDGRQQYEATPFALDWHEGQRASGAWIPSRVNRHLVCAQIAPERRRLVVRRAGDGWRAVNGLGAALDELAWRAPDGHWYGCDALADGGEATLTSRREPAHEAWSGTPRPPGERRPRDPEAARVDDARDDVGYAAWRALDDAAKHPCVARATLAGALAPIAGPTGIDERPVVTHLVVIVEPE